MNLKKVFLGSLAVAAMGMFSACSNEEPAKTTQDGEARYLSVVFTGQNGSRAAEDFEDGDATENAVSNVRFYFFNSDGSVAAVKSNGTNWVDGEIETEAPAPADQPNVEKVVKATVIINLANDTQVPARVFAVLNYDNNVLGAGNKSLAELRAITGTYSDRANAGSFVMSNSVYANNGAEVYTTDITADKYCITEEQALKNPVEIYVERATAKVRVNLNNAIVEADGRVALKDAEGKALVANGQQIYLNVKGWTVTATTERSNLVKAINAGWTNTSVGGFAWNWAEMNRSFWAINSQDAGKAYYSFDHIANATKLGNSYYAEENAADFNNAPAPRAINSKVIIAGLLEDAAGTPMTVYKWLSSTPYADEASLLAAAANSLNYYSRSVEGGNVVYTKITPADIKLVPAELINTGLAMNENQGGRYESFFQLTEQGAAKVFYNGNTEGVATAVADMNAVLIKDLGSTQVWKGGMTYYYVDIKHIDGKVNGVVRNHIYDVNINKIAGLGTAVYDKDLTIIPEKPNDRNTVIAASIKILSWRVVPQVAELVW